MANYEYNLSDIVKCDFREEQKSDLIEKGYVFNEQDKTYDLYEEKFSEELFFDIMYKKEVVVNSPLSEYEIYTTKKTFDVSYKILKKEKWFTGFFKNLYNRFISKKENDVDVRRLEELDLLISRWEIKDLKKIENISWTTEVRELTDAEISELKNKWVKHAFVKLLESTKEETTYEKVTLEKIREEDLNTKYDSVEKEVLREYKEEVLVEKIVVERRVEMENTLNYYVPGIWSKNWSHEHWSKANFTCKVVIEFISWFSPTDPKFFDAKSIKENVIDIINKEHPNTVYIREREDNLDWFNLEQSSY